MNRESPSTGQRTTIGARLLNIKRDFFVGRERELALFSATLSGRIRDWQILNPYGPGGVGKSSLLDAYRRIAEQHGALYVYMDARDLSGTPELLLTKLDAALHPDAAACTPNLGATLDALHSSSAQQPLALVLDTYEDIGPLDRWMREEFLPQLPEHAVVVIAGRYALQDTWRNYSAWQQLVCPIPLELFVAELTREYLALHGVTDADLVSQTHAITSGHPLALSLAATLLKKEGPTALAEAALRPEVLGELAQRWLREIPDPRQRELVEAAATVRCFDQELLGRLAGAPVAVDDFNRLTRWSFVRRGRCGWSLHDLMRNTVAKDLQWRRPAVFQGMRLTTLRYFAYLSTTPGEASQRSAALQEFFYLLGNGLVRAALFAAAEPGDGDLRVTPASAADLPMLTAYMDDWREHRGERASVQLDLMDHDTRARYRERLISEPREPDFLNLRELLALDKDVVRLLKGPGGELRGLSIILPVNRDTLPYLMQQPVTRHYFLHLKEDERADYAAPRERTTCWFVRLIDVRDPSDAAGRAALLRDLVTLLIRPALFLTSTPLALYRDLLTRFGFVDSGIPSHYDFAPDRPAPTYVLDLRGPKLTEHLSRLLSEQTSFNGAYSLDDQLAGAVAAEISSWTAAWQPEPNATPHPSELTAALLEKLTPREREVVDAALEGVPNRTIAAQLSISEITVKKHMSRIFVKLGVSNRAHLIKQFLAAQRH